MMMRIQVKKDMQSFDEHEGGKQASIHAQISDAIANDI